METEDNNVEKKDGKARIIMPDMSRLVVSSSPHYHINHDVRGIMIMVMLALVPALAAAVFTFGWRALAVTLVCMAACVVTEAICCRMMGRDQSIGDWSAALTGMLLGMNLPPTAPFWMCIAGSIIAVAIGKMCFGGLGGNPFNPALVGRVALFLACPAQMSRWLLPVQDDVSGLHVWMSHGYMKAAGLTEFTTGATALVTGPTPLSALKQGKVVVDTMGLDWTGLFLGNVGGSLGEVCSLALLVGGLYLICKNVIRWQIPFFYIGTVAAFMAIVYLCGGAGQYKDCGQFVTDHILSGGLFLGAFFMATDMVTSPLSRKGAVVFAIGCGLITSVIRMWGAYPEGVSFSILIMNALTPAIDHYTAGKPFGVARKIRGLEVK